MGLQDILHCKNQTCQLGERTKQLRKGVKIYVVSWYKQDSCEPTLIFHTSEVNSMYCGSCS
jgi:hypothetical protein